MNYNNILVYDFETSSISTTGNICEIGAVAIDGRSLEIIEGSSFRSLVKPTLLVTDDDWEKAQGAFNVNKLTRSELEKAPLPEHVWPAFVNHIKQYNYKGNNVKWNRPIAAGHNIQGFDMYWVEEYSRRYGTVDKEGKPNLFNPRTVLDTLNILFYMFENSDELTSYSLDNVREYVGASKKEKNAAHTAMGDVLFCAELLIRYLKAFRVMSKKIPVKGSFRD